MRNVEGVLLWLFRSLSDISQPVIPLLAFVTALIWWRRSADVLRHFALLGGLMACAGLISHLILSNGVRWVVLSQVEYIPSDGTSLFEAIIFMSFINLGLVIYLLAVFLHFFNSRTHQSKR